MAITTAERNQIIELTVLMFNAAPGATYLSQIVDVYVGNGRNLQTLANILAGTSAYTSLYPSQQTAEEFADEFLALLELQNDLTARDFVIGKINAGVSKGQIAYEAYVALNAVGDTGAAQYTNANAILNNKTQVATYYSVTKEVSASDLATLQGVVASVTADQATVTAAQAAIDNTAVPGTTFTLATGVDVRTGTAGDDVFDGSVNSQGVPTLTSVDNLNGGAGTDLLIGGLAGGNIATKLSNIENAEFITAFGTAFDLVNTTGLQSFLMRNSVGTLTVNNIGATTGTAFSIQDQAADVNLNFTNGALAGANSFTLNLSGAQSDGSGGADVTIVQQAGTDTSGLETVTVDSGGSTANFLDSLVVTNAGGTSTIATLNVTGAQSLTVATPLAASVRTVDASGMTGAIGLSAGFGATGTVTVTGSGGDDSLTFAANAANANISAGAGNDVVSLSGFTTTDTVAGGDGTADRLDISAANAEAIAAALTNTTGFEQLSLNTVGTAGAAINATRFGAIDTVRLSAGTAAAYGVTMQAGTVNLGVGNVGAGTLGGALTVTDTGSASSDVLNLGNRHTTGALDVFAGVALTSAGYETVNLSTGAVATAAQTVGLVTLNNDSLSGANTLNISGINGVTVAGVASNSSGLLTIDASGLTGAAALTMGAAPTFTVATGTVSITGSANADTLLGTVASAATIAGGAGNDAITGGTAADSLAGDAGNDVIIAGGGNDTVTGGDGNDVITMAAGTVNVDGGAGDDTVAMGATLSVNDVVVGGEGTDTLSLGVAATAATAAGVSGFETLTFSGVVVQGLEQFTTNPGFTRVNATVGSTITVTNASANVATLGLDTGVTATFDRLVDTSTNTLAIAPLAAGAIAVAGLTIDDEETVTVSTTGTAGAAANITVAAMSATDLTSLTISGAGSFAVGVPVGGAANLATVNASGNTGAVTVDASTSTANMTMTGSFAGVNALTGGTGSDTITGGTAADVLVGGNGGDLINGGAGADALAGGLGADVINGEIGDDTIAGGVGNDSLSGGEGADDFVFQAASNGVDTITGFVSGTDDLNVTTNAVLAAVVDVVVTTAGAGGVVIADNTVAYVTMNGAAANLTTAGVATLSGADLTASTLTNLAAYLDERFDSSATNANDAVLVINWTAGSSTTSYVYEHVEANATAAIEAGELTLIGIVDRGATVLTAGDVI